MHNIINHSLGQEHWHQDQDPAQKQRPVGVPSTVWFNFKDEAY